MVLVKYHQNKHLLTKNIWYYEIIFSSKTPMLSLQLSFMSPKDHVNFNIFTVALLIVCDAVYCIDCNVFCLERGKGTSVLFSTKDKRIAIKFHESQRLTLGNQYHKDAT